MRWRTTGKNRPMKMVLPPCRAKYCSVFSRSFARTKTYLPYLSSSGLPPAAPSQYESREPVRAPALLRARIAGSENTPRDARKPANGITSSDGTGTIVLSSTISKNNPGYPRFWTTP
jgi:hypothetical protein